MLPKDSSWSRLGLKLVVFFLTLRTYILQLHFVCGIPKASFATWLSKGNYELLLTLFLVARFPQMMSEEWRPGAYEQGRVLARDVCMVGSLVPNICGNITLIQHMSFLSLSISAGLVLKCKRNENVSMEYSCNFWQVRWFFLCHVKNLAFHRIVSLKSKLLHAELQAFP